MPVTLAGPDGAVETTVGALLPGAFGLLIAERLAADEMRARARDFRQELEGRRSVRFFSEDPVPEELIRLAIETASSAPSGAHRQPCKFVAISDPAMKTSGMPTRMNSHHTAAQRNSNSRDRKARSAVTPP